MLLAGQRSYFELTILHYEYEAASPYYTDRNTLRTALRTGWQHHRSTAVAPLLLTWEASTLLLWLGQLLRSGRPLPRLQFTESNLRFECVSATSDEFLLQIQLADEAAPDWHHDPRQPFWIPVVIRATQLEEAIRVLEQQIQRFPVRP